MDVEIVFNFFFVKMFLLVFRKFKIFYEVLVLERNIIIEEKDEEFYELLVEIILLNRFLLGELMKMFIVKIKG